MARRKQTPPPTPWKDRTQISVVELLEATKEYTQILAVAVRGNHQKAEYGNAKHRDVLKLQEDLLTVQTQIVIINKAIEDYKP